jgi:hypothetical protein
MHWPPGRRLYENLTLILVGQLHLSTVLFSGRPPPFPKGHQRSRRNDLWPNPRGEPPIDLVVVTAIAGPGRGEWQHVTSGLSGEQRIADTS